jgi:hypothetical protein
MKRLLVFAALLGCVALVAGSIVTSAAAPNRSSTKFGSWGSGRSDNGRTVGARFKPASHEGGQTIVVREHVANEKFINVDGPAPSGDYVVFRNWLTRDGVRVGHENGTCMVNFPATERRFTILCQVTLTLYGNGGIRRGKISVEGPITFGPNTAAVQAVAITGGTGHYQNVRGEVHVETDAPTPRLWLHLLP